MMPAVRSRKMVRMKVASSTTALGQLISGELPLDEWVARVRATVPPAARGDNVWRRTVDRVRRRMVTDSVKRPD